MLNMPTKHGSWRCPGCRACFTGTSHIGWHANSIAVFEKGRFRWHLRPNPGYWGDSELKILVLGFSKGHDQQEMIDLYNRGRRGFEDIPFNSTSRPTRKYLAEILLALGVIHKRQAIDDLFKAGNHGFGFASMVRCTVEVTRSGGKAKSKPGVRSQTIKSVPPFYSDCIDRYVINAPKSVKLVILLSADKKYVDHCREQFGGVSTVDKAETTYAYIASGRTFVHVPSPSSEAAGFKNVFIGKTPPNPRGKAINMLACRDQVIPAVRTSLGLV